jgi:hypothetical protein
LGKDLGIQLKEFGFLQGGAGVGTTNTDIFIKQGSKFDVDFGEVKDNASAFD